MLVNCFGKLYLACGTCRKVNEYAINYFNLTSRDYIDLNCSCGELNASIYIKGEEVFLNIYCCICDKVHIYSLNSKELFKSRSFSCIMGARISIFKCLDFSSLGGMA